MHSKTGTLAPKIISTGQWQAWRKEIADADGTLAVVTGAFTLLHPGNLAIVREAARRASHVCVIIHPDEPVRQKRSDQDTRAASALNQDAETPGAAVRLEITSHLRAVSIVTTCLPGNAETALTRLQPFTLVDCAMRKTPSVIASAARKLAKEIVDLAPFEGCITADIQKAIREGRTPISLSDAVLPPLPERHDLDRFLDAGASGRPLVTVNGCFDLLHLGHMRLLAQARKFGARLLVLVNDDDSVRTYKGAGRPIFPIRFRLHALNALDAVAMAYPFSGDNPLPLLATIRPDIHVKGGSFEETRVREERRLVESWGGRLESIPLVEGFSTTTVVKRMAAAVKESTPDAGHRTPARTIGRQTPDTGCQPGH